MLKNFLLVLFLFIFAGSVFSLANTNLKVNPMVLEHVFKKNEPISGSFIVSNVFEKDFFIEIKINKIGESSEEVMEDLGQYISLSENSFVLKSGESKQVNYLINLPLDLQKGLHRSKIIVKPALNEQVTFAFIVQIFVDKKFETIETISKPFKGFEKNQRFEKKSLAFINLNFLFLAVVLMFCYWFVRKYY